MRSAIMAFLGLLLWSNLAVGAPAPVTVATVAALQAGNFSSYSTVYLEAYSSVIYGGGGILAKGGCSAADYGTCFQDAAGNHFFRVSAASGVVTTAEFGSKADNSTDLALPFIRAVSAMKTRGCGTVIIPGGAYKWTTNQTTDLAPSSGATFINCSLIVRADGAKIALSNGLTSYALTLNQSNVSVNQGIPILQWWGGDFAGNSVANGMFNDRDLNFVAWHNVTTRGFTYAPVTFDGTQGSGWAQHITILQSENVLWDNPTCIQNASCISWTASTGSTNSYSRNDIYSPYVNTTTGQQAFWVGDSADVYDSVWENIRGNNAGSYIGSFGASSLIGLTIRDVNIEANGGAANKGAFQLRNYPAGGSPSSNRPTVYGYSASTLGSGTVPLWVDGMDVAVWPELSPNWASPELFGSPVQVQHPGGVMAYKTSSVVAPFTVAQSASSAAQETYAKVGGLWVTGDNGAGDAWIDEIYFVNFTGAGPAFQHTISGTPPARTYTVSGSQLIVSLDGTGSAGTYTVSISATQDTQE